VLVVENILYTNIERGHTELLFVETIWHTGLCPENS